MQKLERAIKAVFIAIIHVIITENCVQFSSHSIYSIVMSENDRPVSRLINKDSENTVGSTDEGTPDMTGT